MSEDKEKYSGDLYGYEVMLRVLDEETWIVDVRDEVTDEYVDGYEFENYDEALAEYTSQVHHLCNHREPVVFGFDGLTFTFKEPQPLWAYLPLECLS